jgi:fatty-acyl-CoA synthase
LFHSRAGVNPVHAAVVEGERIVTYAELEDRTNRLANYMIDLGLERGDRVGIFARNCAEYVEVELAAAKAGVIVAALNWRLGDRELGHCARLVEPKLIISQGDLSGTLDRLGLPEHKRIILGDDYGACLAEANKDYPDISVEPEDGLVILYTSGTTGLPKGALISHRAMIARAMCFASEMEVHVGDYFVA